MAGAAPWGDSRGEGGQVLVVSGKVLVALGGVPLAAQQIHDGNALKLSSWAARTTTSSKGGAGRV